MESSNQSLQENNEIIADNANDATVEKKEKKSVIDRETGRLKKGFLSGAVLKNIAIVTMFIDHFAASIFESMLKIMFVDDGYGNIIDLNGALLKEQIMKTAPWFWMDWMGDPQTLLTVDLILRKIGRIAFPIFCFFLIEGFKHTRSKLKYAIRLGIFALVSEIPFDMALMGNTFEFIHQNVFFTLLIALLGMWALSEIEKKFTDPATGKIKWYGRLALAATTIAACLISLWLRTDYELVGVAFILIMYFFRHNIIAENVAGGIAFCAVTSEIPTAQLGLAACTFYNGKRGRQNKFFFYIFYPAHLLLLALFRMYLGI